MGTKRASDTGDSESAGLASDNNGHVSESASSSQNPIKKIFREAVSSDVKEDLGGARGARMQREKAMQKTREGMLDTSNAETAWLFSKARLVYS
jgi:hypothetical protein